MEVKIIDPGLESSENRLIFTICNATAKKCRLSGINIFKVDVNDDEATATVQGFNISEPVHHSFSYERNKWFLLSVVMKRLTFELFVYQLYIDDQLISERDIIDPMVLTNAGKQLFD